MFAPIYLNLRNSIFATGAVKSTFYRWLCGAEPSLRHLAALDERLSITITISYLNKFIKTAKELNQTNELEKISKILSSSTLEGEDMLLLADYHKNRIWKKTTDFLTLEDSSDEC